MAINVSASKGINIIYNASSGDTAGNASITGADKNNLRFNNNMSYFANGCTNLIFNLQSIPVNTWENVTNMHGAYYGCRNIVGSPVCGDTVIDMISTYVNCQNLTGSPICGNNVYNMCATYRHCNNLTGSPVCGPNVKDMCQTYYECYKLTGNPVCGDKVIDMNWAYDSCLNLTGSPVCGPNVTDMIQTYYSCNNLTGSPVCGPKVRNMSDTYRYCSNLAGSMFMKSNNVNNTINMLYYHDANNRIDIWTYAGTTTNSTLYSNQVGCGAWTLDSANNMYYNATNNIYVHYNWNGVIW